MKSQANQTLVNYIWTYLHQGYSLSSIRETLKKNNYTTTDINQAIDYVYANYYYGKEKTDPQKNYYSQKPKHKGIELPNSHLIIPITLVILGILLLGGAIIALLTIEPTEVIITEVQNPRPIEPSQDIPPVNQEIELEERDVEEQSSEPPRPSIPNTQRNVDVAEPFSPDIEYTSRQIDLKVAYFGTNNPQEAIKFCDSIKRDIEKDFCYQDVAQYSGNFIYCQSISNKQYEDDCYLNLVLEDPSQSTVCNNIQNDFKKDNCLTVATYAQNEFENTENVQEGFEGLNPEDYASVADFY